MKVNHKALRVLLIALIVFGVAGAIASAQDNQPAADTGECVFYTTAGYVENDEENGETNDDANVDDHADGETNDDANNDTEVEDDNQAGDTGDDDANEVDDHADGETNDDANEVADGEDDAEQPYVGSIVVDETTLDGLTPEEECAAMTALATTTPEDAQSAAEAETGLAAANVQLDVEDTYLVYDIEMEDGSAVKVDAGNGAILRVEPVDDAEVADDAEGAGEGDEADAVAPSDTGITADDARAIAEAETGSTASNVEYDVEGDVQIWEVEMDNGTDVQVNANDGTVILVEERDAN